MEVSTMLVRTQQGSTYAIGPSRRANYVQVSRVSDHAVSAPGRNGQRSFAEDFSHVEVISDGTHLRLLCTREGGRLLRTSPIVGVTDDDFPWIDIDLPRSLTSTN